MGHIPEQLAIGAVQDGFPVFTAAVGVGHLAPCQIGNQLVAVADAENGDAQIQYGRVKMGRCRIGNTVGAAGKDDTLVPGLPDLGYRDPIEGLDFCVHLLFPNPPGNELVILSAKIQNQNFFFHRITSLTDQFPGQLDPHRQSGAG